MEFLVVCMFLGAFLPYFNPGCEGRLVVCLQEIGFIKRVDKGWITTVKDLESYEVCLLDYRKLERWLNFKSYVFVLSSISREKIQFCTIYFVLKWFLILLLISFEISRICKGWRIRKQICWCQESCTVSKKYEWKWSILHKWKLYRTGQSFVTISGITIKFRDGDVICSSIVLQ